MHEQTTIGTSVLSMTMMFFTVAFYRDAIHILADLRDRTTVRRQGMSEGKISGSGDFDKLRRSCFQRSKFSASSVETRKR